jgi:hypothetical protein
MNDIENLLQWVINELDSNERKVRALEAQREVLWDTRHRVQKIIDKETQS